MNQTLIKDFYAYTLFVQQYYRLLHRYASLIVPPGPDADRIVASVMLSLWDQRKKFDTKDSIRSFLKKRVRLQCNSWLLTKTLTREKL